VILVLLGITAGCGRSAAPAATADLAVAPSLPPGTVDVVDVVCAPAGTRVSATRSAAQRDGLHVRVQNTSGATGVYLTYRHGPGMGLGGGEPVESGTVLVLSAPPGQLHLNCAYDASTRQDRPVAVEVLDPTHAWRTGALGALGCSPPEQSLIDWVYRPGTGSTAEAALTALAAQLDKPVTWRHVQEGYVAAASQVYVLTRAGVPWATASVTRSAAGGYDAALGSLC